MNKQKAIAADVDVDFITELFEDGASPEAIKRLTNDEQAFYLKLKRDSDMAAKKKPAVKKTAVKKTTEKKVTPKPNSTKVVPVKVEKSKREVAQEIFDKHFNKKPRKDILALFMSEAKLTKAGSSTYYANMKKKFEDTGL